MLPKSEVQARVEIDGVPLAPPQGGFSPTFYENRQIASANPSPTAIKKEAFDGPTIQVPLIRVAHGRSGDKGDTSNIGIVARRPEWLPWLRAELTEERVADWLAHLVQGRVTRYDLPGIHAMNFVCEQALGGGGMASLRNDPLGKGMGQILLCMPVAAPAIWGVSP